MDKKATTEYVPLTVNNVACALRVHAILPIFSISKGPEHTDSLVYDLGTLADLVNPKHEPCVWVVLNPLTGIDPFNGRTSVYFIDCIYHDHTLRRCGKIEPQGVHTSRIHTTPLPTDTTIIDTLQAAINQSIKAKED